MNRNENHIAGIVLLLLFSICAIFLIIENSFNTEEERFYLVDKNWHIKTSEYYTEVWYTRDRECTRDSNRKETCKWVTNRHSKSVWIKDCRAGGNYEDPVYYPPCPQSRSDSWFTTTEYFTTIWGKNEEKMTLFVNLEWYNWLKREEVCNMNVYRGIFGNWLKSIKDCN